ncbi:MAG: HD domain-containing phosphohydrolase, partial [bacterium]
LTESEQRLKILFEFAPDAYYLNDLKGSFVDGNKAAEELTGYTKEELMGKSFLELKLLPPTQTPKTAALLARNVLGKRTGPDEFVLSNKDGTKVPVEIRTFPVKIKGKTFVLGIARDISARKKAMEDLRALSLIDQLTGLYNRRGFFTLLEQQIQLANRTKKGFYILFADVDKMKWINDNLGHHEGDIALQTLANICRQSFRKSDIIARIGGDEFAICAIEAMKNSAELLVKRLKKSIYDYNNKHKQDFKLSLSIGTTYYDPENPCSIEELLELADKLMYLQKMQKNSPRLTPASPRFPDMDKQIEKELYLRSNVIKILMIEDNLDDYKLFKKMIARVKETTFEIQHVADLKTGIQHLMKEHIDIVLLDLNLPDSKGLNTLKKTHSKAPGVPIIVLTAHKEEDLAVKAIREGAQDCFIKGQVNRNLLVRSIRYAIERKYAELELKHSFGKFLYVLEETINTLASIVEMRDPYTAGHQKRVSQLAQAIAKEMDLTDEQTKGIKMAALIHDLGKIQVPEEILNKPKRLSDREMKIVQTHPGAGYEILRTIQFPWLITQIVHQHHERINGSGYPKGITGKDTLLESKILAVADVVEAMTSHRPYRPAPGLEKALEEIMQNKGKLYDPDVVDTCIKLFKNKDFKFASEVKSSRRTRY